MTHFEMFAAALIGWLLWALWLTRTAARGDGPLPFKSHRCAIRKKDHG